MFPRQQATVVSSNTPTCTAPNIQSCTHTALLGLIAAGRPDVTSKNKSCLDPSGAPSAGLPHCVITLDYHRPPQHLFSYGGRSPISPPPCRRLAELLLGSRNGSHVDFQRLIASSPFGIRMKTFVIGSISSLVFAPVKELWEQSDLYFMH